MDRTALIEQVLGRAADYPAGIAFHGWTVEGHVRATLDTVDDQYKREHG